MMRVILISMKVIFLGIIFTSFMSCAKNDEIKPVNNSDIAEDKLPQDDTLNKGMEYWKKTTQNNIIYFEPS